MNLNHDFRLRAVQHAADAAWTLSPLPGVDRRMLDRVGGEVARATSIVRYAAGSRFDAHNHPGGEEILVLDGVFSDEHGDYPAGTWLRNPRWSQHTPFTGPEFLADRLRFSRKQKSMTTTALDFTPLLPAGLPPAAARLLAIHAASGMRVT